MLMSHEIPQVTFQLQENFMTRLVKTFDYRTTVALGRSLCKSGSR